MTTADTPTHTHIPTIDADRLWQRLKAFSRIGATPAGGVHRLALSEADIESHVTLAARAKERGFSVALDDIGNMFMRRAGRDNALPPVTAGSHTDSQRMAGRYDGMLGVLAAFEALEAIDDAGLETDAPLEVIVWNNEEGARFIPACMGSAVYAGVEPLEAMRARTDADGISVADGLAALNAALPDAGHRDLGTPLDLFIEAHIEQAIEMETNGTVIGAVTGMAGYRRFTVSVIGEAAHSGTTPRARRKDAFVTANALAHELTQVMIDDEDLLRFTIGRFTIPDGGISVVPGRVDFTIDLRHPDEATLRARGDDILSRCEKANGLCTVTVDEFITQMPLLFPDDLIAGIERSARRHDFPFQQIYSAASHDARHASRVGRACMLFIPCWKGISHNEAERIEPGHAAAAAQVICDLLVEHAIKR